MRITLSQEPHPVDLAYRAGDPISLAFSIADLNVADSYIAQVRRTPKSGVLTTLTVTAVFEDPDTAFTLTAPASSTVGTDGDQYWDLQRVGGTTLLAGRAHVSADVSR